MNEKLKRYLESVKDKKILIQGLGLNGGGVGVAKFFLQYDIPVTITDLKSESELANSIKELSIYQDGIRYVLGRHREEDFTDADIVVKGPGVNPNTKYIKLAKENGATITSDIGIFCEISPSSLYAVTGSKGKSTVVTLIYNIFKSENHNSFIGGNITISPLNFLRELNKNSKVILELSSWQLRDIKDNGIKFNGAMITNLLNDHQNYYNNNMIDYLNDKAIITKNQNSSDFLIIPKGDKFINTDNISTDAKLFYFSKDDQSGDFYSNGEGLFFRNDKIIDKKVIKLKGEHNITNGYMAASFSYLAGIDTKHINSGLVNTNGTPYRLELIRVYNGISFYNDTTATIPDAMVCSINSFSEPVILIAGGNDKNLDFSVVEGVMNIPKKILLLPGSGTDKMKRYIHRDDDIIEGQTLEELFEIAMQIAKSGDVVLLSPGATSFGLFQNEFHRGDIFNQLVKNL